MQGLANLGKDEAYSNNVWIGWIREIPMNKQGLQEEANIVQVSPKKENRLSRAWNQCVISLEPGQ